MQWASGYSAHWRVFEVNPETWAESNQLTGIRSVTIERDCTGDTPLLESGSISLDEPTSETFGEKYLRIVMDARQGGGAERVDVATMLCCTATGQIDKQNKAIEVVGRSVLYPASVRCLLSGEYAPKGIDGVSWVASTLKEVIAAPIQTTGSFTLEQPIVFDFGTTYLEAIWMVLNAGHFVIQIAGDGTVHILPMPSSPELVLDSSGAALLHPSINYEIDYSDVPNRYIAVEGSQIAIATNDSSGSVVSTLNRGYDSDFTDTSPVRVDGESLAQYAERMLEQYSVVPDIRTYSREYYPGILPFSLVRGTEQSVAADGVLRVVKQTLTCDKGITVSEEAHREVYAWKR